MKEVYVVIKVPEKGDHSKSAKFFDSLDDAMRYKDMSPYPEMVVAMVAEDGGWLSKLLFAMARLVAKGGA